MRDAQNLIFLSQKGKGATNVTPPPNQKQPTTEWPRFLLKLDHDRSFILKPMVQGRTGKRYERCAFAQNYAGWRDVVDHKLPTALDHSDDCALCYLINRFHCLQYSKKRAVFCLIYKIIHTCGSL